MKNITVLVTSIGGPVAQGVLKGLNEIENIRIIGGDRREITPGNLFCDQVYTFPRFTDVELYMNKLNEIIEKESIDAFIPGHPMEIELYNECKEQLDIPVGLPDSNDYQGLLDKEQVYIKMKQLGLDRYVPYYVGFNDNKELKSLKNEFFLDEEKLIAKEVSGYGAIGMGILTNRENYLKAKKAGNNKVVSIEDYLEISGNSRRILMKVLDKPEYSVDIYVHNNEVIVAVPRKRVGVSSGLVLDGTIENNTYLINASKQIAGKLIDNGFLNLQFMLDDDGYKLTDINPRFCGSQVMSLGAGINFPELFIQYELLNEKPEPTPLWGTRMMRYRDTYFVRPENNIESSLKSKEIAQEKISKELSFYN